MNRRGVTLIELVIVFVLIGVLAGLGFPRLGDAMTKQSVSSARTLLVSLHAKARATAIQRGSQTQFVLDNGKIAIRSSNPVTNVTETVGNVDDLVSRYGVTVQPTNLTLTFDARGIGMETNQSTISITKGSYATQIVISSVGRVIK